MPAPQLNNPPLDAQLKRYYADIDELTADALAGQVDESEFRQEMERLTLSAILLAFLLAGGNPDTPAAQRELEEQRRIARNSTMALSNDIFDGRYSRSDKQTADEGQEKLRHRLDLWAITLVGVYHAGQIHQPARRETVTTADGTVVTAFREPRQMWLLGPTEEHCPDCARLAGQVHTTSEWQRASIRPQSPDLACTGRNCLCQFIDTDAESMGFVF